MSDARTSKTWQHMGAVVAKPIGRFWVGPEFVGGEPVYVRRTPEGDPIAMVEASTTPFMPETSGVEDLLARPEEHPAGW
jgi:hypothetical protein